MFTPAPPQPRPPPPLPKKRFLGGGLIKGMGGRGWGGGVSVRTRTNVSNGTSTLQGEHLCKIILKSMHIYIGVMAQKSSFM